MGLIKIFILWIVFSVILLLVGERGKGSSLFSIVLYGYLPNSLILLIRSMLGLPGRGTDLMGILPQNTPRYLIYLLNGVDIFHIWSIVLIIYGISILYNLDRKKVVIVSTLFIIYSLIIPLLALSLHPEGKIDRGVRRPIFRFFRPRSRVPSKP